MPYLISSVIPRLWGETEAKGIYVLCYHACILKNWKGNTIKTHKKAFYTSKADIKPFNLFLANWYFVPDYLLYLSSQAKISKN